MWDTPEWREIRDQKLLGWMKQDANAVACVVMISGISEIWDDLIDKDRELSAAEINNAFMNAVVNLRLNPFYRQHESWILPVIVVGINAWMDANELEKSTEVDKRALSFYVRNYCYEVCSVCAFCAGGFDWLRSISNEMRLFAQHESYFSWEKKI